MQFLFMSVLFECELRGARVNRKITTIDVFYKKVKKPQIVLVIRIIYIMGKVEGLVNSF